MPAVGHGTMLAIALLCRAPMHAAAQDPPLSVGDKIRVLVQGQPWSVGSLAALDTTTLVLIRYAGDTSSVPLGSLRQLDVAAGRRSNSRVGALAGALFGGVIGAIAARETVPDNNENRNPTGGKTLRGGLFGVAAGAALGAAIGALVRSDRWRMVPITRVRLAIRIDQ